MVVEIWGKWLNDGLGKNNFVSESVFKSAGWCRGNACVAPTPAGAVVR